MFVLVVDRLACKSVYRLKWTNNDAYTRTPHPLYATCIVQSHFTHTGWDNGKFKPPRQLRQIKRHLKINICVMVTILQLLLFSSHSIMLTNDYTLKVDG